MKPTPKPDFWLVQATLANVKKRVLAAWCAAETRFMKKAQDLSLLINLSDWISRMDED